MEFCRAINYTITIEPTANKGFYVSVGCGRFVFSNPQELVCALEDYLGDPKDFEKKYNACGGQPRPDVVQTQQGQPNLRSESAGSGLGVGRIPR